VSLSAAIACIVNCKPANRRLLTDEAALAVKHPPSCQEAGVSVQYAVVLSFFMFLKFSFCVFAADFS
jgi:hypothetical protein